MRYLMGGDRLIMAPDERQDFSGSPESSAPAVRRTGRIAPAGESGDCVFRRIYITHRVVNAASFRVRVLVDGQEFTPPNNVPANWNRITTSHGETVTTMISLVKRGSHIQLEFVSDSGYRGWTIDKVEVMYQPGQRGWQKYG